MYNEEVMQQMPNHFSELVMLFWFIKVHYFLHRSIWMSYVVSVKPRIRGVSFRGRDILLPGLDSDKKYFFDNQRRNIGHFKQTITSNEREFIVESNDVIENTF